MRFPSIISSSLPAGATVISIFAIIKERHQGMRVGHKLSARSMKLLLIFVSAFFVRYFDLLEGTIR